MVEKPIKKEQITVDKEFLELVLKTLEEVKTEIEVLKKAPVVKEEKQHIMISKEKDYIFWCVEITFGKPINPQDILILKLKVDEFRKKLEDLMREYRIGQVNATMLAKQ